MELKQRAGLFVQIAASAVVAGAATLAPITCFLKDSSLPQLLGASLQNAPVATAMWNTSDSSLPEPGTLYAQALPDGGNIALHFEGFSANSPRQVAFVNAAYCQGSAQFYPRRVVATEPGTIVNSAPDILARPFVPTISSLQAQDVRLVLKFVTVQNKVDVYSIPIPPPTVPSGGPH